jgi:hypothetical protein
LIPTVLSLLYDFLSLKNDVNVPSKSNKQIPKFHGSATLGKTTVVFFALTLIYVRRRELHNDTGSEASQESGIFSTGSSQESPRKEAAAGAARRGPGVGQADNRRPGLGRRAITQINLKERKNSYNSALARSQENLVQVGSRLFLEFF